MIRRLFRRYRENWRILREAVNEIGADCEGWTYAELDRDAEEQPLLERIIGGRNVWFTIDCWEKKPNGDLVICIDADGLPTLAGVKPSYGFVKRVDGSVYYR